MGPVRALAAAAHAAARDVTDPAAVAAARAAGHAAAVAHMASHALGAAAYAARAATLAAEDDSAGAQVVEWAEAHASPAVRDVLRQLPSRTHASGPLGALPLELQRRIVAHKVDDQEGDRLPAGARKPDCPASRILSGTPRAGSPSVRRITFLAHPGTRTPALCPDEVAST